MWKRSLAVLPGIGVSLLPKLACPLCWRAYAGLLSALGLGFLISAKYLLPLTVALLAIAVLSLTLTYNTFHLCYCICYGIVTRASLQADLGKG